VNAGNKAISEVDVTLGVLLQKTAAVTRKSGQDLGKANSGCDRLDNMEK